MAHLTAESVAGFQQKFELRKPLVGLVGMGYVGTCLAAVLGDKGFLLRGVELHEPTRAALASGKSPFKEPDLDPIIADLVLEDRLRVGADYGALRECDVVLVTVGTPLKESFEPELRFVREAAESLAKVLREGQVVILKSTVVPGTTADVVRPLLEAGSKLTAGSGFGLAFCPERFEEGNALRHLRSLPVVVGADDDLSRSAASAFWRSIGLSTVEVSTAKAAELVKLADNLWIDVNIALANELAILSDRLGVDSLEVIRAANTLPKGAGTVNIMTPGPGAGGSCLTKDPWFVDRLGREAGLSLRLPAASRGVHESMPDHVVRIAQEALEEHGLRLAGARVTVLGLTFKERTSDLRGSSAITIVRRLQEAGAIVRTHDPWVGAEGAGVTTAPAVASLEEALREAQCIVLATAHPEFRLTIDEARRTFPAGVAVVDTRHVFDPAAMRAAGFAYRGLGRGQRK